MTERDLLFLVMILIGTTSLVVFIVQLFRSRDGSDDSDDGPVT